MACLTVGANGRVTLSKEILEHLGVAEGGELELRLLPGGAGILSANPKFGSIDAFIGLLEGRSSRVASIEEITQAAQAGWAGRHDDTS